MEFSIRDTPFLKNKSDDLPQLNFNPEFIFNDEWYSFQPKKFCSISIYSYLRRVYILHILFNWREMGIYSIFHHER